MICDGTSWLYGQTKAHRKFAPASLTRLSQSVAFNLLHHGSAKRRGTPTFPALHLATPQRQSLDFQLFAEHITTDPGSKLISNAFFLRVVEP